MRNGREAVLGDVAVPERGQEALGIVHRLRRAVEAGAELLEVGLGAAEPDRQRRRGEVRERRVGGVEGIDLLWIGLAVAADLASYAGGAIGGRGRVPGYGSNTGSPS